MAVMPYSSGSLSPCRLARRMALWATLRKLTRACQPLLLNHTYRAHTGLSGWAPECTQALCSQLFKGKMNCRKEGARRSKALAAARHSILDFNRRRDGI